LARPYLSACRRHGLLLRGTIAGSAIGRAGAGLEEMPHFCSTAQRAARHFPVSQAPGLMLSRSQTEPEAVPVPAPTETT
jgi:hypothetical protein